MLSSTLRAINYGDGTQQNPGYFGLKGEAALQGYEGAQKAVQEAREKLAKNAKNDRVKEMCTDVASRRIESELNTMARFVGQERVRAADTVSEARLSEAANDAARAWNNPTIIQRSIGLAVNEVKDMAERNGWGKEVEAAKVREATSVIATGAAKAALAVEATGAAQRWEMSPRKPRRQAHGKLPAISLPYTVVAKINASLEENRWISPNC